MNKFEIELTVSATLTKFSGEIGPAKPCGREWYPATRTQNFGNWSLPLAKGPHKFEVLFLDFRPGDKTINRGFQILPKDWDKNPCLDVTGPGFKKGPIPTAWLFSAQDIEL